MKFNKEHIKLLLLAAVAILLLIMVITLLRRGKDVPDNKALIEAYDKAIAAKEQVIALQEQIKEQLERDKQLLMSRDTFLIKTLVSNQPKYISNEKKLNQIPITVGSLSKDEFRSEFADHANH